MEDLHSLNMFSSKKLSFYSYIFYRNSILEAKSFGLV